MLAFELEIVAVLLDVDDVVQVSVHVLTSLMRQRRPEAYTFITVLSLCVSEWQQWHLALHFLPIVALCVACWRAGCGMRNLFVRDGEWLGADEMVRTGLTGGFGMNVKTFDGVTALRGKWG